MCFKKFTLIFLLGIMCLTINELKAQQDATINPDEILYWIGEGSNEAVFIVNWNNPDTALAWGYRFNDEFVVVENMMQEIAETDLRLAYDAASGFVNDITFQGDGLNLHLSGSYWLYLVNGTMAEGFSTQRVYDGDYVKWGDESCGTDIGNWNYVWTKEVAPVFPYLSVDEHDIQYITSMYPNPAISFSTLTIEGNNENIQLLITDIQGRTLRNETLLINGIENVTINTENLVDGMYLITVKGNNGISSKKLIVR